MPVLLFLIMLALHVISVMFLAGHFHVTYRASQKLWTMFSFEREVSRLLEVLEMFLKKGKSSEFNSRDDDLISQKIKTNLVGLKVQT